MSLAHLFDLVGKLVREWMAKLRGSNFGNIWTWKEPHHVAVVLSQLRAKVPKMA
jgi:hypothetical protein